MEPRAKVPSSEGNKSKVPMKMNLQFFASEGAGSNINYGRLDSLGRTTVIQATITQDMIGTGNLIPSGVNIKASGSGGLNIYETILNRK